MIIPEKTIKEISDEEYDTIVRVIKIRYGIDFSQYEKPSFKRRLSRAIRVFKFDGIHALWSHLLKNRNFIFEFIDELTVGMTTLFRDDMLWNFLHKNLVNHLEDKGTIDVWHTGCSTGEEVYSMGIILENTGLLKRTQSKALDLSKTALRTAQSGIYNSMLWNDFNNNFKKVYPLQELKNYLVNNKPEVEGIYFRKDLIKNVVFEQGNLLKYNQVKTFDIIFCRNVMIYFDERAKTKLLDYFHTKLKPNGLLVIGFYDSVFPLIDNKKYGDFDKNCKVFIKQEV